MSFSGTIIACVAIAAWASVRHARIQNGEIQRGQFGGFDMRNLGNRHRLGDDIRSMIRGDFWKPQDEAQSPSQRENELQREVEDLRKRIAVLERITTDANSTEARRSRDIAAEIESLRDR